MATLVDSLSLELTGTTFFPRHFGRTVLRHVSIFFHRDSTPIPTNILPVLVGTIRTIDVHSRPAKNILKVVFVRDCWFHLPWDGDDGDP